MAIGSHGVIKTNVKTRKRARTTQRSVPDSGALDPGHQKKPVKGSKEGPSDLNRVLDRLCQIHGTPDKPADHTHRECWVFKQVGKLNAKHKGRETPSEDEDEPRQPNTGGQKNSH